MSLKEVWTHRASYQSYHAVTVKTRLLSVLLALTTCVTSGCGGSGSTGSAAVPSTINNPPAASQTRNDPPAGASVPHAPGPNAIAYASPTAYSCKANYYVSTGGIDSNHGSASSPWRTLAHAAAQNLMPGSCVNVAPGVYRQGAPLNIVHGGVQASPAGYVAWRCKTMPFRFSGGILQGEGNGCVIRANTVMFALVPVSASYVIFDGFEIDGNSFEAQRGFQVSGPGIDHSWLLNSDVHHCGQNGIALVWSDWLFVIHDVWHDNSACSVQFIAPCRETIGSYGSGLSIWEPNLISGYLPTPADNAFCSTIPVDACFHIVVEYNVAFHNYNGQTGSGNTDGEGIIFDTWNNEPYIGAGLIMGNVVYDNGGSGIEVFDSARSGTIVITNNTTFDNHWDTHSPFTWSGEIVEDNAYNVINMNNIAYAVGGSGILAGNPPFVAQESGGSTSSWSDDLSYPAGRNRFASGFSYRTSGTNKNGDGFNPEFALATPGSTSNNFALTAGSPAIAFGQVFSLWPQLGPVDAGACPSTLADCP